MALRAALVAALVLLAAADESSLIQRQLDVEGVAEGSQGACQCLNWKSAYESKKVRCGNANEYFVGLKNTPAQYYEWVAPKMAGEFCQGFYEALDDNVCVNIDIGGEEHEWYSDQWCYVSSECNDLNGGKVVKGRVGSLKGGQAIGGSMRLKEDTKAPAVDRTQATTGMAWKVCKGAHSGGADRLLRDMDVPELAAWCKEHKVDLGLMVNLAYFKKEDAKEHDSKSLMARKELQSSENPLAFDLIPHHKWQVINGGKNYVIQDDPNWNHVNKGEWKKFEKLA